MNLKKSIRNVGTCLTYTAMATLLSVMSLVTINVVMRTFFSHPIKGTYDLCEFMMAATLSFAFVYTTAAKAHVMVSLVVSHLPPRGQALAETFSSFFGFCIGSVITWQTITIAIRRVGETTSVLFLPISPIMFLFAFGIAMLTLELLIQFVDLLRQLKKLPSYTGIGATRQNDRHVLKSKNRVD